MGNQYQVGSVLITEGTPAECAAAVQGAVFIHSTNYVYSGTAGSYVVFIEVDIDN